MPLSPGQTLEGKYVIARFLAEGGMGEVYEGVNTRIDKRVAVKVLRREHAQNRVLVDRFEMEAKIAASIHSAHIADVYDMGELPSGERFIVMEFLEGETLADRLARVQSLNSESLLAITTQILDGLSAAHAAGIVHRDLKPENVFLTSRDRQDFVKLVDFGISKVTDATARPLRAPTRDGALLGTPMYMSPEQARGNSKLIDHRTDIYALGVMMYEMACGDLPFAGDNVNELLFRIALEDPQPLTSRRVGIDPSLAAIVHKAMSRDLADRYASADAMKSDLASWKAMFSTGPGVETVRGEMLALSVDSTNSQLLAVTLPARPTSEDVIEPPPRSVEIDVMGEIEKQVVRDTVPVTRGVELDMHSLSGTPVTLADHPPKRRRRARAALLLAPAAAVLLSLAIPSARQRVSDAVLPMLPSTGLASSVVKDLNPIEVLSSTSASVTSAASPEIAPVAASAPAPLHVENPAAEPAKVDLAVVDPDVASPTQAVSTVLNAKPPRVEPPTVETGPTAKAPTTTAPTGAAAKPAMRKSVPAPSPKNDTQHATDIASDPMTAPTGPAEETAPAPESRAEPTVPATEQSKVEL